MAISYVGGNSASATNGGDPSVDLTALTGGSDSSAAQDDLVIATVAIGSSVSNYDMVMVSSGYTEVADLFESDAQDINLGVFYKFMGASPDTTAVGEGQGTLADSVVTIVQVFRGVDLTTPMDVAATTSGSPNGGSPDPASIDWSTAGTCVVIAGGTGHISGAANLYTFPAGYTTDAVQLGASDTNDVTGGMGYNLSPSDPEDPGVMTIGSSTADQAKAAVTMALRPAAAAAGGAFTGWGIPIF